MAGNSNFPRTQSLTDGAFKKYAEQVYKYLEHKKKTGQ